MYEEWHVLFLTNQVCLLYEMIGSGDGIDARY